MPWQLSKVSVAQAVVSAIAGFLLYAIHILLPHAQLLFRFASVGAYQTVHKLIWSILFFDGGRSSFGIWSFGAIIVLSVLFAVNVFLILRIHGGAKKNVIYAKRASTFFIIAAFLGYGCIACGTGFAAILPVLGLSALAAALPLLNISFYAIAIVLSIVSIFLLIKKSALR